MRRLTVYVLIHKVAQQHLGTAKKYDGRGLDQSFRRRGSVVVQNYGSAAGGFPPDVQDRGADALSDQAIRNTCEHPCVEGQDNIADFRVATRTDVTITWRSAGRFNGSTDGIPGPAVDFSMCTNVRSGSE